MELEVGKSYLVEIEGENRPSVAVYLGDGKWKVLPVRIAYQRPVSKIVSEITASNNQRDAAELIPDYPDALENGLVPGN